MLGLIIGLIGILGLNPEANTESQQDDVSSEYIDTLNHKVLQLNRILIIGNKKTRDRIISRELSLLPGDTTSAWRLNSILARDKNKIYNLTLFNTVTLKTLELPDNKFDILVEVSERWYIFPIPIFELSDRNFNEWWQTYNHDFTRINYGLKLYQRNFRGRNEYLRVSAQFGFTRKYELLYRIPNLDRNQKHGLTFQFDYGEPKNVSYYTEDHKLLFLRERETLRTSLGFGATYSFRKSFYETHSFELEYRDTKVADTIALLNPNYYRNGRTSITFGGLTYGFNSDHRDVIQYPLKGYQFGAIISKFGLGLGDDVNQLEVNLTYSQYLPLKNNFNLSNFTSVYYSTPNNQPYALYSALGYRRQFIRGYEIYVIEGPKFFLNKTTLKKKIFSRTWHIEEMPMEQFQHFPLVIYLKGFADLGYVENYPFYDENQINNTLSSRFLIGAGAGIDVVTAYDAVFRFEYSFTREGTHGFFFNIKKEF